jgi:signal transduction histidine kinase
MSSEAGTPQENRETRAALFAAVVFLLVVAAITAVALERERRLLVAQAHQDARTFAALFEENTARTFDGVDTALQGVAAFISTTQPPRHDTATRETMRARLRYIPTVRALFVIGPDGRILHDTDFPRTPDVSLADRPYFRQYLQDDKLERSVSEALLSRSGTGWFVASTRRIQARDGRLLGVAVAAVQLDSIAKLYRKLDLQPAQQVSLLQSNGTLLARHPSDDALVGRSFAQFPVFSQKLSQQRTGTFSTSGPPWDYERIVSYRALESQPLVVLVSTRLDAVLAPWRRTAAGAVAGLAVLALLTAGAVMFFLQRQRERGRIAERRRQEEQLRLLAQDLSDVDRRRSEFLATLSHELRNVLTPVQNCAQILKLAQPGSAQSLRAREILVEQLQQMRRLVDDLLDISRVNSGKLQLHLEAFDLRGVLTQSAAAAHAVMERAHHSFEMELPPDELVLNADPARLQQVFANLLGNAAKYTPTGGHIRMRARRDGDQAVVAISDDGLGIPQEAQIRIFGMFEQVGAHSETSQGGLGIGLALVHRIVALHGGAVEVFSEGTGKGSTFTVRLPVAGVPRAAPDLPPAAAQHALNE